MRRRLGREISISSRAPTPSRTGAVPSKCKDTDIEDAGDCGFCEQSGPEQLLAEEAAEIEVTSAGTKLEQPVHRTKICRPGAIWELSPAKSCNLTEKADCFALVIVAMTRVRGA